MTKNGLGHLVCFFTVFVWGNTFVATKILLKSFTPIEILFFRFFMGALLLFIVYPHKMVVKNRLHEIYFALAGLSGITLYFLLENIALTHTYVSNVGVIVAITPLFIAILARIFLKEKLTVNFFIGFLIAFIGVALITFNGRVVLQVNPLGDILAILASLVWAFYSIIIKKLSLYQYHNIQLTRRIFVYGLIFMIPAMYYFDFKLDLQRFKDPVNLYNILFLGCIASAVCFATWSYAVKLLGAVKASVYIYLSPVVTVTTSVLILKETITKLAMLGILLTLAGLLISENIFKKVLNHTTPVKSNPVK